MLIFKITFFYMVPLRTSPHTFGGLGFVVTCLVGSNIYINNAEELTPYRFYLNQNWMQTEKKIVSVF